MVELLIPTCRSGSTVGLGDACKSGKQPKDMKKLTVPITPVVLSITFDLLLNESGVWYVARCTVGSPLPATTSFDLDGESAVWPSDFNLKASILPKLYTLKGKLLSLS